MSNKILTLLGFCRKAGKLIVGTMRVTERIKENKPCLVMLAEDVSAKTKKELEFYAGNKKSVVVSVPFDTLTVSKAIGTKAGVIATYDEGFKKAISTQISNLENTVPKTIKEENN